MEPPGRALLLLSSSFGLAWVSIAMVAAPGPAALVTLSGRAADAGLFFAIYSLASAAGGALTGRAMDRWGRRGPLVAGHLLAGVGFGVAGLGYGAGSLPSFIAGEVILAFGIGGLTLTRVAAAELVGPSERARAVARVSVAATIAAVSGPLVLVALAAQADRLVWFVAPPIYLLSAFLVSRWREAPHARVTPVLGAPREPIPRVPFLLGFLALICAQAAMVTVMGVTGVELRHAGHTAGTTALVMSTHFLGMFGLSLFVGRIADRFGRRLTILAGVMMVALGGAVVAFFAGAMGLIVGLLLVGVGWSFSYIGGTVVLADVIPAARRARTIGLVDLSTALLAALASFAGGVWYAREGLVGLGLAAVAIVLLPLIYAVRAREPSPGRYVT